MAGGLFPAAARCWPSAKSGARTDPTAASCQYARSSRTRTKSRALSIKLRSSRRSCAVRSREVACSIDSSRDSIAFLEASVDSASARRWTSRNRSVESSCQVGVSRSNQNSAWWPNLPRNSSSSPPDRLRGGTLGAPPLLEGFQRPWARRGGVCQMAQRGVPRGCEIAETAKHLGTDPCPFGKMLFAEREESLGWAADQRQHVHRVAKRLRRFGKDMRHKVDQSGKVERGEVELPQAPKPRSDAGLVDRLLVVGCVEVPVGDQDGSGTSGLLVRTCPPDASPRGVMPRHGERIGRGSDAERAHPVSLEVGPAQSCRPRRRLHSHRRIRPRRHPLDSAWTHR